MFTTMMDGIKEESVGFLFNIEVQVDEAPPGPEPTPSFAQQAGMGAMGEIGVSGEPVPSPAPAAFTDGVESQAPNGEPDDRQRVADVLGQVIGAPKRPANLSYSAPTVDGEGGVSRTSGPTTGGGGGAFANVSRNAPCPCGSGRKFKRCHGAPDAR